MNETTTEARRVTIGAIYDLTEGAAECLALKVVDAWYKQLSHSRMTFQAIAVRVCEANGVVFHSDDVEIDDGENQSCTYRFPDGTWISGPSGFGEWRRYDTLPPGTPTW